MTNRPSNVPAAGHSKANHFFHLFATSLSAMPASFSLGTVLRRGNFGARLGACGSRLTHYHEAGSVLGVNRSSSSPLARRLATAIAPPSCSAICARVGPIDTVSGYADSGNLGRWTYRFAHDHFTIDTHNHPGNRLPRDIESRH